MKNLVHDYTELHERRNGRKWNLLGAIFSGVVIGISAVVCIDAALELLEMRAETKCEEEYLDEFPEY